jgi:hypothetical protein
MNVTALPAPRGGALVTHTDITSRHQQATLAQGLQEAARLESLGLLAGGIAHDFNNILTGVLMNLSAVKPAVTTDPRGGQRARRHRRRRDAGPPSYAGRCWPTPAARACSPSAPGSTR